MVWELDPLAADFRILKRQSGRVALGMRQAFDDDCADRVAETIGIVAVAFITARTSDPAVTIMSTFSATSSSASRGIASSDLLLRNPAVGAASSAFDASGQPTATVPSITKALRRLIR